MPAVAAVLSYRELERVAAVLDEQLVGSRLEKIVQPDEYSVVLSLYGRSEGSEGRKRHLLLSCRPRFGRVSELGRSPTAPDKPPAFSSFLRARIARARLSGVRIAGSDRQLLLHFEAREGAFELLLSLLGNRSNLYLLDAEGLLRAALRPLEQTRRTLAIGAAWQDPPPPEGERRAAELDRFADIDAGELLVAIERAYAEDESESEAQGLHQRLAKALRKERKAAQRRLERIEAELADAERSGELQRHGELLKGALGRIAPGASEIVVRDYETDEDVTIPLDPAKTPQENLSLTFKRYQKLIRRVTKAGGQIEEAQARCAELSALEAEVQRLAEAGDPAAVELAALAERPEVRALLGKAVAPRRAPTAKERDAELPPRLRGLPRKLMPRRYRSADGLEIWVGRSDECNDHLTTRLARGNDLFFHLDGAPGSHVILRTEGRTDPPNESVLDACELAVRFSKHKNASRADVHVVPIKQVKKPKGAKRGLVYVRGGKTVHLRREEARLERVLGSKIDD